MSRLLATSPTPATGLERRQFDSAAGPAGWAVAFRHPIRPALTIRGELKDASYGNLSFQVEPAPDPLDPGCAIDVLEVIDSAGAPTRLAGEVRFVDCSADGRTMTCGLRVRPASHADEPRWHDLVNALRHPRTRTGSAWCEQAWELFEATGYFRLSGKDPTLFSHLKQHFFEVNRKLDAAPGVGFQVVCSSERGLLGTGSWLRPYRGTFFGHQLAKRISEADRLLGKSVLRDIYLRGLEQIQADPELRWFAVYADATVPWARKAHLDFLSRYQTTERGCLFPFRLMEAACTAQALLSDADPRSGPATGEETETLLAVVARTRPRPYCEALDLVPSRFDLRQSKRRWQDAGLAREREVVVLRWGGAPVAAAVLEVAEDGCNLFHLFDGVRLFPLAVNLTDEEQEEAYASLLEVARRWYSHRGKCHFVYFLEEQKSGHAARAGLADLGAGWFWIIPAALIPDHCDYVREITRPRSSRG
jgi:hypothetical protein